MTWKPHALVFGLCAALVSSQSDQTTTWWWWTETSTTPPSTAYLSSTQSTQPSSTATPYPHYIQSCSGYIKYAYLDVVFLFDSTSKARFDGFLQQVAFISDFVSTDLNVGLSPRQTRVAFINVGDDVTVLANLSTIASASQATSILQSAQFKNASSYNLDEALNAADGLLQNGRPNIKKAVIVFSTYSFICDSKKKSLPKGDPCSQIPKFLSNDWAIVSVGVRLTTSPSYPKISLGWPCYEFQDDYTYWSGQISSALTNINCYCPTGFSQFVYSYNDCYKTGECVRLELQNNDYCNWYDNSSVTATPYYDQCPYLTTYSGFQTAWWLNTCTDKLPFFCQTKACDSYTNICA